MITINTWQKRVLVATAVIMAVAGMGVLSGLVSRRPCERRHARWMSEQMRAASEFEFAVYSDFTSEGAWDFSAASQLFDSVDAGLREAEPDDAAMGVTLSKARVLAPFIIQIEAGWIGRFRGGDRVTYLALFGAVFRLHSENVWYSGL